MQTSHATEIVLGGEDTSALEMGDMRTELEDWNGSLPPFDEEFYTAICCEPSFAKAYAAVQESSIKLFGAPNNETLQRVWSTDLITWRKCVLTVFTALMEPSLWSAQAKRMRRPIPKDVLSMKASVVAVWKQFPTDKERRDRLVSLQQLFS